MHHWLMYRTAKPGHREYHYGKPFASTPSLFRQHADKFEDVTLTNERIRADVIEHDQTIPARPIDDETKIT